MKKMHIVACVITLFLLTACCGATQLKSNAKYKWTYTFSNGETRTGEFETNEFGQASFDPGENVDCGAITLEEKHSEIAMEESAV